METKARLMLAALEKHGELMMNACEMNCEYIIVHPQYREQIICLWHLSVGELWKFYQIVFSPEIQH